MMGQMMGLAASLVVLESPQVIHVPNKHPFLPQFALIIAEMEQTILNFLSILKNVMIRILMMEMDVPRCARKRLDLNA